MPEDFPTVSILRVLVKEHLGQQLFHDEVIGTIVSALRSRDFAWLFKVLRIADHPEKSARIFEATVVAYPPAERGFFLPCVDLASGNVEYQATEQATLGIVLGLFRVATLPCMNGPEETVYERSLTVHLPRVIFSTNPHLDVRPDHLFEGDLANTIPAWVKGTERSRDRRSAHVEGVLLGCSVIQRRHEEVHALQVQNDPGAKLPTLTTIGAMILNKTCDAMWYPRDPLEKARCIVPPTR